MPLALAFFPAFLPSLILSPRHRPASRLASRPFPWKMVEGHAVQRLASTHRRLLLNRTFRATSPNDRFGVGAAAIDGRTLTRVEAIGKNLFHFWSASPAASAADSAVDHAKEVTAGRVLDEPIVVHIHFGMSGQFRLAPLASAPPAKPTTRLCLAEVGDRADAVCGLVSAQLLVHGGVEVFTDAEARLGPDPLREDADKEIFLAGARGSKRSIGALLMVQERIAGVGNIYRAEICYKARVHPDEACERLSEEQLEEVWMHSVDLLQRGFVSGSIVTTDGEVLKRGRRRYVYNQAKCICGAKVKSWQIAQRTAYACLACQPKVDVVEGAGVSGRSVVKDAKVFTSHCAPEGAEAKMEEPGKMHAAELRVELDKRGLSTEGVKAVLVARLLAVESEKVEGNVKVEKKVVEGFKVSAKGVKVGTAHLHAPVSASRAAADKAAIGESRAVEHVADVSNRTDLATLVGKMKVAELRAALQERCVDTSGLKALLVERLVDAMVESSEFKAKVLRARPTDVAFAKSEKRVKTEKDAASSAAMAADLEDGGAGGTRKSLRRRTAGSAPGK